MNADFPEKKEQDNAGWSSNNFLLYSVVLEGENRDGSDKRQHARRLLFSMRNKKSTPQIVTSTLKGQTAMNTKWIMAHNRIF